jgi:holin-like protein
MKYLRQFCIIILVSFLGEILHMLIPLPIPASIYGLVLMFCGLCLRVIPLEQVQQTGKFLVEIMPIMFIPAGVGLITVWDTLKEIWIPVIIMTLVSTVLVMVAAGRVTQWVIRMEEKHRHD